MQSLYVMEIDLLRIIPACLFYEFKLGSLPAHAARKICMAFGKDAVSQSTAQEWFKRFSTGDKLESVIFSLSSAIDNDALKAAVETDSSLTCQELSRKFKIGKEIIRLYLHQQGKLWKLGKWVHHLSTVDKNFRLGICLSLLSRHNNRPFLNSLLTCGEKRIMYNSGKGTYFWLSQNDHFQDIGEFSRHSEKLILCIWWNVNDIIHYEFLEADQAIRPEIYAAQMQRANDALLQKQPKFSHKEIVFLQDATMRNAALQTHNKICDLGWEVLPQPPASPDILPSEYHLFLAIDDYIGNKYFKNRKELEAEINRFFDLKGQKFLLRGIYELVTRWENVVECEGDYLDEKE